MELKTRIEVFKHAERHFDSEWEMKLNEVQIIIIGDDDHDFDPVYVLSASDEIAAKFAADAMDYIFEDNVIGVEITIIDKDCHAIRFSW